jgi:hypothetical protein
MMKIRIVTATATIFCYPTLINGIIRLLIGLGMVKVDVTNNNDEENE